MNKADSLAYVRKLSYFSKWVHLGYAVTGSSEVTDSVEVLGGVSSAPSHLSVLSSHGKGPVASDCKQYQVGSGLQIFTCGNHLAF